MKIISFYNRSKENILHIETELGIINIRKGLTDLEGNRVISVETIPSNNIGDPIVQLKGYGNTRLVETKEIN